MSLLGFLLFALPLCGQSKTLKGRVTDRRNKPLPFANVQLLNASGQSIVSYAISDPKGAFSLAGIKPGSYILKVSFIGFEAQEKKLEIRPQQAPLFTEVSLVKSSTLLNEVTKTVDLRAVQVIGDTIRYRLSPFTDSTEANLREALEKLPGFSVSDRGEVSVNGKKVDKVLVDGDDFMNSQIRVVLETLPAEAAKDIDYIKNYHDAQVTRGLASDKTALNIKLQKRYKNHWKGALKGGAGYRDRAQAALDGYNLNPKFKVYYAGAWNNTGKQDFGFGDYMQMSGGFGSFQSDAASSLKPSSLSSAFGTLSGLSRYDAHHIETLFQALNLSVKPNDRFKATANGIFGKTISDRFTHQRRTYFGQGGPTEQNFTRDINADEHFINTGVTARYTPSADFELRYNLRFNTLYSSNNQEQTQQDTKAKQLNQGRNYSYNTDLTLRKRLGENALGSLIGYAQTRRDDTDYRLKAGDEVWLPTGKKTDLLEQQSHTRQSEYGLIPSYTYKAGEVSLSLRSGLRYADKALDLQSSLKNRTPSRADLGTHALALEATLEKSQGKIQYHLLPKVAYRSWDYHSNGTQHRAGYFFEPLLKVVYQFRDAHRIGLSYQRKNQAYPLKALYRGYATDEINTYKKGGLALGYSTRDVYRLYYSLLDQIAQLNLFISANYNRACNTVTWRSLFQEGSHLATAILNPESETFNTALGGSKALGTLPLRIRMRLGYGLQNSHGYAGNALLNIKDTYYNAQIRLETRFQKGLNLYPRFGYTQNRNDRLGLDHTSVFEQYQIGGSLRGEVIKNLRIKLSYDYKRYKTAQLNRSLSQLGGVIWYARRGGKFQYRLRMVDVLNLDKPLQVSIENTDLYQEETVSSILPGYLMLEVIYRF